MDESESSESLITKRIAPKDRFRFVCVGFAILGITTLLPMSFYITANQYWMYKFRNVTNGHWDPLTTERTSLQTFFESYLTIAQNAPMLLSSLLTSIYGKKFHPRARLYLSLIVMLITSLITTIFTRLNTDDYQLVFFTITMTLVVINSLTSAFLQSTVFGMLGCFPSNCTHAMVNGQAIVGLLAVVLLMTTMINETDPLMNGFWYFLVATIFVASAIIACWLMDNDYMKFYLKKIVDTDNISNSLSVNLIESKSKVVTIIKRQWQLFAGLMIAYTTTLSVFPGVGVLVVPQYPNTSLFTGRFYQPIVTFLLFGCGDLAGRLSSAFAPYPVNKKNAFLALAIARSIFPLGILFCNVQPRNNTPTILVNDIYYPILNGFTGLTNGYIFSSAMVIAPRDQGSEYIEIIGFVMAFALAIGLSLGSVTSSLLLNLI